MSGRLVSIIVPTYNRADCLVETLRTVLAQTHTDWEVVLVDDGSTDNSREIAETLFAGDTRLRYIYQDNAGVSRARNTGLAQAKGDFIAFLDSDDEWMPWKLEAQLACMDRCPSVGMVWTDMEAMDYKGVRTARRYLRTMYSAYALHRLETLFSESASMQEVVGMPPMPDDGRLYCGDIYPKMILGSLVHTSTVLLRRDRALAVGEFDESLKHSGEDYDFHLRTCAAGPVGLLDVPTMRYRLGRPDRLTRHTDATAINFLATIEKAIAADTAGRLRRRDVELSLTDAHRWVAEEKFKGGDGASGRSHAFQSLRRSPLQRRLIALSVISFFPPAVVRRTLGSYRLIKRRLRYNTRSG